MEIEREFPALDLGQPVGQFTYARVTDTAEFGVALIFVEDVAYIGIGQVGPADDTANEIVFAGELEQPAGVLDGGPFGDHNRPIEAIASEDRT
jgi:hypothetical protein